MKITVREAQGKKMVIPFPSALLFNGITAGLLVKATQGKGVHLDKKQARMLIKALNQYRRAHRDWVLVEVDSADGDYVRIKL